MTQIRTRIISSVLQMSLMASVVFFDFSGVSTPWGILSVWIIFLAIPLAIWGVSRFWSELSELSLYIRAFVLSTIPGLLLGGTFFLMEEDRSNILLRTEGRVAFFYLALSLLASPIDTFTSGWFSKQLLLMRKIFGILSFLFFVKHGLDYFIMEHFYYSSYYASAYSFLGYILHNLWSRIDVVIGLIAWVGMITLGLTSNEVSYRALGRAWKSLHVLVYPIFMLSLLHIAFAGRFDGFYALLLVLVSGTRFISFIIRKPQAQGIKTTKYICVVCGYIYDETKGDPDSGIAPGTKWENIPDDWYCPLCKVGKKDFEPYYEKSEETGGSISWTVVAIETLTSDVIELRLEVVSKPNIIPGQFFRFALQDFDGIFYRSYSVARIEWTTYIFLIKIKPDGRAGRIWKNVKTGRRIEVESISGQFILQDTKNPKVFIATGTGLAPVYHMISTLSSDIEKELHFGISSESDIFYQKELETIDSLQTQIYLSREKKDGYLHGRIDPLKIEANPNTEFYICGNPSMTQQIAETLKSRGFTHIYFEAFI